MTSDEVCEPLEFLCNSPQRLQILDALDDAQMEVRDVMDAVDGTRSTVHRNLSALERQGWITEAKSGYTTTTAGRLLQNEFIAASKSASKIQRMIPFFEAANKPEEVNMNQLTDVVVTTPDSRQPTSLMSRLFNLFGRADHVRGSLPVVSSLSVELSRRAAMAGDNVPECEFVVSSKAFDILCQQYGSDSDGGAKIDLPAHITIRVYEGSLPYGLFVSDKQLALTGYNENGRIRAIVESTSETPIEWAKEVYEAYKCQSKDPHRAEISSAERDSEMAN